jgi:hypothetical protein
MRGSPKVYGTIQDFQNVANAYPVEAATALQNLMDARFIWKQSKVLERREDGIEDSTHKIVLTGNDMDQDAPQQLVQMELAEDENAAFFRMGWTMAKAEKFIKQYSGTGA